MAYPQDNDSFRTTENRPGIKYDPAKKTTLFAEDLKALGDSIVSIQDAIGNFDPDEKDPIVSRLNVLEYNVENSVYALAWDATIKQIGQNFNIPALASRAIFAEKFVKLIAFYKAPEVSLLSNLYIRLPNLVMHNKVDKDVYFPDAFYFHYKFRDSSLKYLGRGAAQFVANQPAFIFLNFQSPVTGRYPSNANVVTERTIPFDNKCFLIKDSIIKLELEYLTNG